MHTDSQPLSLRHRTQPVSSPILVIHPAGNCDQSRLEDALIEHGIGKVVLAFERTDRRDFFDVLSACHGHGVGATAHRDNADQSLTNGGNMRTLVNT